MKINNVNITTWGARQSTMSFAPTKYTNASLWKAGAAIPTVFPGVIGFKTLTLNLIVKGSGRDAILKNVSDIVAACRDKVTITLDDYSRQFTGYLTNASNEELSKKRFHRLNLQFNGFEHDPQVEVSGTSSISISNPGNQDSPARVLLTATAAISQIVLTGLCRDSYTGDDLPVTVKSLTANRRIVLNGINGSIAEGNGPKDVDIWRLPSLVPGANTITCDNSHVNIVIQYLPAYA